MTCIVGVADPEARAIYIGADSCAADAGTDLYFSNPAPKVFQVGPLLLGVQGSFRGMDLLRWELGHKLPDIPSSRVTNLQPWVSQAVVLAVRSVFLEGGYLQTKQNVESHGAAFLAGVAGQLYLVQTDFAVVPCPPEGCAIGSGAQPARGSLYTSRELVAQPSSRVRLALEAAAATITTVRGPHRVWRLRGEHVEEVSPDREVSR